MTTLIQFATKVDSTMQTMYTDGAGAMSAFLEEMQTQEALYERTEQDRLQSLADFYKQRAENNYQTLIDARIQATSAGDIDSAQYFDSNASKLSAMINNAEASSINYWERSLNTSLSSPAFKTLSKYGGFFGDVIDLAGISAAAAAGNWNRVGEISSGILGSIAGGILGADIALAFGAMALGPFAVAAVAIGVGLGALAGDALGELFWDLFGESMQNLISDLVNTDFSAGQIMLNPNDPLTFDLDGDGVETIPENGLDGVLFDHNADGVKTATGWVSPDDGFLVRDINGNGTIDSGRELFGDNTLLSDGTVAANGFEALADLDSNADGVIDVNDVAFWELRIWQDGNSDGITQMGELLTLEQASVASINTAYEETEIIQNGNIISGVGSYTKTDGTSSTLGSVASLGSV